MVSIFVVVLGHWTMAVLAYRDGKFVGQQFTVEERGTGRLVGDVGLSPADGEPGVIKVGYTIAPEFQGRGYGTEAIRALVGYALDTLGADVVRAYTDAENAASIRVAEKVGMKVVERFESREGGEVWRGLRYEVRRGDWNEAS